MANTAQELIRGIGEIERMRKEIKLVVSTTMGLVGNNVFNLFPTGLDRFTVAKNFSIERDSWLLDRGLVLGSTVDYEWSVLYSAGSSMVDWDDCFQVLDSFGGNPDLALHHVRRVHQNLEPFILGMMALSSNLESKLGPFFGIHV